MALRVVAAAASAVALLSSRTSALQLARGDVPRTAVLLVGQMRQFDSSFAELFMESIVKPNNADVFVQSSDFGPDENGLAEALGSHLMAKKLEEHGEPPHGVADYQFEDLEKAFKLIEAHEQAQGFKYDVVVKARTEIVPAKGAVVDLVGWKTPGRVHMMTDMIFWGQRDDMEKVSKFYSNIRPYYQQQYADPFARPIDVEAMLGSLMRDARLNHQDNFSYYEDDWKTFNKLETLPYPEMGKTGAIANLQEAVARGITICKGDDECPQRCGDRYIRFGCEGAGDYEYGQIRCEKDIMAWAITNGLVVCDIGRSVHTVSYKGSVETRPRARDCDE